MLTGRFFRGGAKMCAGRGDFGDNYLCWEGRFMVGNKDLWGKICVGS